MEKSLTSEFADPATTRIVEVSPHQAGMDVFAPEIVFSGADGKISIQAIDTKNPSSHVYSIEIGETASTFKAIYKFENFKMIPGTYDVEVSSKGLAKFANEKGDLQYWIAIEAKDSKFGD